MGITTEQAKQFRRFLELQTGTLTDEQALEVPTFFPGWVKDGYPYTTGQRISYGGILYKCLTDHTSQSDWAPDVAPSLWAKLLTDPDGEALPWEQPGSTNPYAKGDKATHNGKTWQSTVDNNVWEPGIYGWIEVLTSKTESNLVNSQEVI